MATLILTTVGTLLGGPVGGAIGALAGRTIDGAVIGGGKREGPRLRELAVTTSSYGQPIARHHGRMRAGGTIVWATDLVEHKEKSGGKKGQPSVTNYSYTTSFAVALSSRPIRGVGRIWADGNLLRGAAGDLKTPGILRIHTGEGDQAPDPLIAADKGTACPAFRGCAYAVFEDLALGDFGNRIPALSFEIIADDGAIALGDIVGALGSEASATSPLVPLAGFAVEGGPMAATLATVDVLFPLACDAGGDRLTIATAGAQANDPPRLLPPAVRGWDEGDFGPGDGERRDRVANDGDRPDAVRYYDTGRDFQPGVQRASGRAGAGRNRTIEFPGALGADDARSLTDAVVRRSGWNRDRLQWRVAELDPALAPGSEVRVPGRSGVWRIEGWEWRSRGIELQLVRRNPLALVAATGDPGSGPAPADFGAGPTTLLAFEVPAAGLDGNERTLFAAATSAQAGWTGAALFVERAGELVPIGSSGRSRATIGTLASALAPSAALHLETSASVEIALVDPAGQFAPATVAALAQGANRLLIGSEVVQFVDAEKTPSGSWILTGLLRGRGGTEPAALEGHPAGTHAVLLDDALVPLDPATVPSDAATAVAAIGLGDAEPVYASLANAGLARRPPLPVHPRVSGTVAGGFSLGWTRRARGAWLWPDAVDAPLVEQAEQYRVGLGPTEAPLAEWTVAQPSLFISGEVLAPLASAHPGAALWVRQVGSFSQSEPLFLTRLP